MGRNAKIDLCLKLILLRFFSHIINHAAVIVGLPLIYLFHFFLNVPSFSFHHSRHSLTAFSRSHGEPAGWKFSQVAVWSRKHISAKNLVGKSLLESRFINSSIECSANFLLNSANFTLSIKIEKAKSFPLSAFHYIIYSQIVLNSLSYK